MLLEYRATPVTLIHSSKSVLKTAQRSGVILVSSASFHFLLAYQHLLLRFMSRWHYNVAPRNNRAYLDALMRDCCPWFKQSTLGWQLEALAAYPALTSSSKDRIQLNKACCGPGKFRGVCDMFGLLGTTFGKLPLPRKPVSNVSGLTLEKGPAGAAPPARCESLRVQFIKITRACTLAWSFSHDRELPWPYECFYSQYHAFTSQ